MLDAVADSLEAKGLIKEAYEIDKVADAIEATANTPAQKANEIDTHRIPHIFWEYVGKAIRPGVIPMIGVEKQDLSKGRRYAILYYGETRRHPQGMQPHDVTNIKAIFDKNKDPDITYEKAGLEHIGYSFQQTGIEGYRYNGINFVANDELPGKRPEDY